MLIRFIYKVKHILYVVDNKSNLKCAITFGYRLGRALPIISFIFAKIFHAHPDLFD